MSTGPFFTVLTNTGAQIDTAAKANGQPVNLTHLSVGDGTLPTTVANLKTRTSLINQNDQVAVTKVSQHPSYPDQLVVEGRLPESMGGWYVREVGVRNDAGLLYGIARWPETFKPNTNTVDSEMYIRLVVKTSGDPNIEYQGGGVNPEIPEQSVVDLIRNTHATESKAGSSELATQSEVNGGSDGFRIVTPKTLASRLASFLRNATESKTGMAELATQSEVDSGTDHARIVTPKTLTGRLSSFVRNASETVRGFVEIATQTEANSNTDDTHALTPKKLYNRLLKAAVVWQK